MKFLDRPAEYARGAGHVVESWYLPCSENSPERWLIWVKDYSGKIILKTELDDDGVPHVVPVKVTVRSDEELAKEKYYEFVHEYIGAEYTQEELDQEYSEVRQMKLAI